MASRVALCSLLLVAFLLASSPRANSVISSGQVASALWVPDVCGPTQSKVLPCMNYLKGTALLPASCCNGVKSLIAAATTRPGRQTICTCFKSLSAKITGLQPGLAAGLPRKCGVKIGYAISPSADCSKVR